MRLKEIRIANNYLQKDIANILNIKRNTYSMWELEHDKIPLKKLIIFAEHFNVSLDYIFELTDIINYDDEQSFNHELYLKRIKEIRKENNTTQAKLGLILNTNNSVISRYESGETFILTEFILGYSKTFNVSIDYLLGKTNHKYLKTLIKN